MRKIGELTRSRAILTCVLLGVSRHVAGAAECSWVAARDVHVGTAGEVESDLAAGSVDGAVVLAPRARVGDGSRVDAARVSLEDGASVDDVGAVSLVLARGASVRGTQGVPQAGPADPRCDGEPAACGGATVHIRRGERGHAIMPGTWGALLVDNGGEAVLGPGAYRFCRIVVGRHATVRTTGAPTLDVAGDVAFGNDARLVADGGGSPLLRVGGGVTLGRNAAVDGFVAAPAARVIVRNGATVRGGGCAGRLLTGRHTALTCPAGGSTTTTTSTSSTTSSTAATTSTSTSTTTSTTTSTSTTTTVQTTSTTTSSTTSSTSMPTTTSTTMVATTTTTAPPTTTSTISTSTSTSTTSTTSSSTTTTTVAAAVACGPDGLFVTMSLDSANLAGVTLDVGYPPPLDIQGSGFETDDSGFTDLTNRGGTFVLNDRDTNGDQVDDSLRIVYALSGVQGFGPGSVFRQRFDCPQGTQIAEGALGCTVVRASDTAGNVIGGVHCTLSLAGTQP